MRGGLDTSVWAGFRTQIEVPTYRIKGSNSPYNPQTTRWAQIRSREPSIGWDWTFQTYPIPLSELAVRAVGLAVGEASERAMHALLDALVLEPFD